jgi:hypothetical protein
VQHRIFNYRQSLTHTISSYAISDLCSFKTEKKKDGTKFLKHMSNTSFQEEMHEIKKGSRILLKYWWWEVRAVATQVPVFWSLDFNRTQLHVHIQLNTCIHNSALHTITLALDLPECNYCVSQTMSVYIC